LPMEQRTIIVDRLPSILCIALTTAETNSLPNLNDPEELLKGVKLKYENLREEVREVTNKTVSLV